MTILFHLSDVECFDDKYFDVIRYAISREIVVDDNLIKDKKYV